MAEVYNLVNPCGNRTGANECKATQEPTYNIKNMKHIDSRISEYLKNQTNYAVLITGPWGVGKTYYFRNSLKNTITSTQTLKNESKNYKAIYISLFGLTSIKDIQNQIFIQYYPLLNNKTARISGGIARMIGRGATAFYNLGNFDEHKQMISDEKTNWIDINEIVLCFDDLERISGKLPLEEIIGFINTLVENDGAKVIIIANQDAIDTKPFKDLREKTIGVTVEFSVDVKSNIKSIIEKRYSQSSPTFAEFITSKLDLITSLGNEFKNNLRTLIYSLDNLRFILKRISEVEDDESQKIIDTYLESIVRFTLAVSIEYKEGILTFKDKHQIDKSGSITLTDLNINFVANRPTDSGSHHEPSHRDSFITRYYNHPSDYVFFESIFSFVTGSSVFETTQLFDEVKNASHIKGNATLPQYDILNKLNYHSYYHLSEKDYRSVTRQMVKFAEEGKYGLQYYPTVYLFALRFDNMLRYNEKVLLRRIIAGVKKAESHASHEENLEFYLEIRNDHPNSIELTEIKNAALQTNQNIKQNSLQVEADALFEKMTSDWDSFLHSISDPLDKWRHTPIFCYAELNKTYYAIKNLNLAQLHSLAKLLGNRYNAESSRYLVPDLQFLKLLEEKLAPSSKNRKTKNLRNFHLNLVHEVLTQVLSTLESNTSR